MDSIGIVRIATKNGQIVISVNEHMANVEKFRKAKSAARKNIAKGKNKAAKQIISKYQKNAEKRSRKYAKLARA